jgi:hypothetical protein
MKRHLLTAATAALIFTASVSAQMQHPAPAPELKKLDYFVGTWNVDADMKPSPFGPGGKTTGTDHYEWMQGNYFLIIHSTYSSQSMGSGIEYAVIGYDTKKKQYTYESFSSDGEHDIATGTPDADGKVWTWYSASEVSGPTKWRFTQTILSPTSYTIKFEMSKDATNWSTVMDGKVTKQ